MAERPPKPHLRVACARALLETMQGTSLDQARARQVASIPPGEQALARELLDGTVRWYFRLDWQLQGFLQRPIAGKDSIVQALLLLGFYQLQHMRTPPARVVNESVTACRMLRRPGLAGLVNAILRRGAEALTATLPADAPETARHASPQWLIDALRTDWPQHAGQILSACNERAPMALRINRQRTSCSDYLEILQQAGIGASPIPGLPFGLLLEQPVPVRELPGHADGLVSVQDISAQLAGELLPIAPGDRVLDACAAPGGKSAHLLEACPQIRLTCLDVDERRLDSLGENLHRLGLRADAVVAADAGDSAHWWDGAPFDRILLDAPCSATGVIRRHPDIRLLRRQSDIAKLAKKQRKLLQSLWKSLKPGGLMLYATCSLLRQENEAVVSDFLRSAKDAQLRALDVPGAENCPAGSQRFPEAGGGDGFFFSLLERA